jgi:hypothetical protein
MDRVCFRDACDMVILIFPFRSRALLRNSESGEARAPLHSDKLPRSTLSLQHLK